MATKFLHEAQRGASKGSIDFPLALLAGLSVGFVAFVLPADLLSRVVELSQVPSILPAAEPPLGNKARAALAAIAAGGTILAVFLLLRMLGRQAAGPAARPRRRERDAAELEPEFEAPRLRRSDVHPDAPARRPILAARELGEPAPARASAPAPAYRPEDCSPEPQANQAEDGTDGELELAGPGIEMLAPAPAPQPAPEPAPVVLPQPPVVPEAVVVPSAAAEPPPPLDKPAADASIAELMARLERGLARRRQERETAAVAQPAATVEPAVLVQPDRGDDRLRSAIENLQKMAARGR